MTAAQRRSSMRDRFREQVREDVKVVALDQLADGGPQAISLNAIARQLGVSGPALYRYYTNRDELLTELVTDAYRDLAAALARAVAGAGLGTVPERMRELADAYRGWARAQPHRYELLFKPPLPGYDAHAEPISEAASSLMVAALDVFGEQARTLRDPDQVDYVVRVWSQLHGIVSLELGSAYSAMDIDADSLFADAMHAITERVSQKGDHTAGRRSR